MRLIECYVENFGKISREKFSFKDGLNCIKNDNGSGKTTLAAFIKIMLYGMSDSKKQNLDENERKHYLPWQGGVCGGSLTFSAGGKTYRVERQFGTKASDDTYALYDTATGRISTDFPDGLGEGLFGIDADGFERTVFLSERALTPKSTNKSISAKLSDLVGCDGDIGGMDDAIKRLEEKRKFYYKKGGSGELADTKAKIDDITRKLDALSETEKAIEGHYTKMREISAKIDIARADAKKLLKAREEATLRAAEVNHEKQYREIKASLEDSEARRRIVADIFGANIPSREEIDVASYKSIEAKNLLESATDSPEIREFNTLSKRFDGKVEKGQIDEMKNVISGLAEGRKKESDPRLPKARRIFAGRVPSLDEIDAIEKTVNEGRKKTPFGYILAMLLSIVMTAVGIILPLTILTIIGGIGIFASIIILVAVSSKASADREKKINDFFRSVSNVSVIDDGEAKARLGDMRELLPIINDSVNEADTEVLVTKLKAFVQLFPEAMSDDTVRAAERIIKDYDRYAELAVAERYMRGDRAARSERAERLKAESDAFVRQFKTRTQDPFGELRAALTEYERLTAELVAKRDEMANIESLNKIGESSQMKAAMDIESLDKQRNENEALVASLSREYALTERMYNSDVDALEGRDELVMRKSELEELLTKESDNYATILKTKEYLSLAKDNMTSRYLGKTKAGFIKYAEKIGGITGESFEINTDFGITKQEGASTREVDAYSRGTRDLYNMAARLGLVDSLYEKESPFIILDDPFTAFDDKKTSAALKLLSELAKEKQVIYFTCSKSRSV